MTVSIRVPGSTSNLGAGFDCVGLALDLWLEARVVKGEGPAHFSGTLEDLDPADDIISAIVADVLPDDTCLEVHSEIPLGRGLGSSGTATVAGIVLRNLLRRKSVDREAVFRKSATREGHPDNVAPSVFGGLVLAAPIPFSLTLSERLTVALAVPDTTVSTKAARAILPDVVSRDTTVAQAARAAALIHGLVSGNAALITHGFEDHIATPYRAALIPGYDQAVDAAKAEGAFGATISGSGPTILAIAPRGQETAVAGAMAAALMGAGNPAQPITPAVSSAGFVVGS